MHLCILFHLLYFKLYIGPIIKPVYRPNMLLLLSYCAFNKVVYVHAPPPPPLQKIDRQKYQPSNLQIRIN